MFNEQKLIASILIKVYWTILASLCSMMCKNCDRRIWVRVKANIEKKQDEFDYKLRCHCLCK